MFFVAVKVRRSIDSIFLQLATFCVSAVTVNELVYSSIDLFCLSGHA
jgi:hypothetical protein